MSVKKNEEKLYDLRTLDNFLARGLIKPADYEKYLKALPDDEGHCEWIQIEEEFREEERVEE